MLEQFRRGTQARFETQAFTFDGKPYDRIVLTALAQRLEQQVEDRKVRTGLFQDRRVRRRLRRDLDLPPEEESALINQCRLDPGGRELRSQCGARSRGR